MTTTFQSREAVRDELVALFTANASWQAVYGYFPGARVIAGLSPVLIIRSRGTRQAMQGLWDNEASYRFILTTYVVAGSESDSFITSAIAEDELDNLDKVLRQVIRTNAGALVNADSIEFASEFSEVSDVMLANIPYIMETHTVITNLYKGSVP